MAERSDDGSEPGADRAGDFQAGGQVEAGQKGAEQGDAQDAAGLPEGGEGAGRDPGLGRATLPSRAEAMAVTPRPTPNPVSDKPAISPGTSGPA